MKSIARITTAHRFPEVPMRRNRSTTLTRVAVASVIVATACERPTSPDNPAAFGPAPTRAEVDLAAPLVAYATQLAATPVATAFAGGPAVQEGAGRRATVASMTLRVDDDGRQCPGALTTIQAAVAAAPAGATIVVCPGTYHGSVDIVGPSKNGLQLIAAGTEHGDQHADNARSVDKVVLAGDDSQANGFYLQDVSGVRVQGFTVRDFGLGPSMPGTPGMGNNIVLLRAHGNVIARNVLAGSDMMGILLVNSGRNLVEHNVARDNDAHPYGFGCGIMLSATSLADKALSANNVFRNNVTRGNPLAGIMIRNAGPGTVVSGNVFSSGGRFGLTVWDTNNALLEHNEASHNRGLFTNAAAAQYAYGIDLRRSDGSVVRRNIAVDNGPAAASFDVFWDGVGAVNFDGNRCDTSQPGTLCSRGDD